MNNRKKWETMKKGVCLLVAGGLVCQGFIGGDSITVKADKEKEVSSVERKEYSTETTYASTPTPTILPTSTPIVSEDQEPVEVIEINTLEEFKAFAEKANKGESFKGKLVKLVNDIVFDGVTINNFQPIEKFQGIFDGNGHSISGILMVEGIGTLFNELDTAIVRNLEIKDCEFDADISSGIAYKAQNSRIQNCKISGNMILKGKSVAGIVIKAENCELKDCFTGNHIEFDGCDVAGIGLKVVDSSITSCNNTATIVSQGTAAGIAGAASRSTVDNCRNENKVEGWEQSPSTWDAEQFKRNEETKLYSKFVSGIVGMAGGSKINNCYNKGTIVGAFDVAGIAADTGNTEILNCMNVGNIFSKQPKHLSLGPDKVDYYMGAIAGECSNGTIFNCCNQANINGSFWGLCCNNIIVGGLIGKIHNSEKVYIQNCFQSGTVMTASDTVQNKAIESGLIGEIYYTPVVVNNCYFLLQENAEKEDKGIGRVVEEENVTIRNLEARTDSDMKSDVFLNVINRNRGNNTEWLPWVSTNRYPVLETRVNDLPVESEEPSVTAGAATTTPAVSPNVTTYPTISPRITTSPSPMISSVPDVTTYPTTSTVPVSSEPLTTNKPQTTVIPSTVPLTSQTPVSEPVVEPINQSIVLYAGGNTQNSKTYNIKVNNLVNYELSYESSNPDIAGVSGNGTITAKKAGTASVFVVVKDKDTGKSYSFVLANVTVKKASLSFTQKVSTLKIGKSVTVKVRKNGIKGTVKWSVSNKKYASINNKGILKAKKAGTVKVTASCGKQKATMTVKIKK